MRGPKPESIVMSRLPIPPAPMIATVLSSCIIAVNRSGNAVPGADETYPISEVDKVQIPEKIMRKGPLAIDALIDDFLAGESQKPARPFPREKDA